MTSTMGVDTVTVSIPSSKDGPAKLLDRDEIFEGLEMGMDVFPISTFWDTLEHFHQTGKRHWLMTAYIVLLNIVGFTYCFLGFVAIFVIDMDFKRRSAAIMNPICGLQTVFKCWTFSTYTAQYLELLKFLRRDFISCVPPEKAEGAKAVAAKNVLATNQFVKYAMRWNCVTLCMVSFMPYLRSQAFREFLHIGNGPIIPNKICENEYPFDWNTSPNYEIIWFYEQIAVIIAIVTSGLYQAILLFLVMALVGHLKVLGFVMENFKATDFASGNFTKLDKAQKKKAYHQLMNCIKDHQKIVRAGDALAERYNVFLTFHLGTAVIVGIVAIFNCSTAESLADTIKFGIMCGYGLLEVAIYCACGQLLENASEDVLRQVYQCEWEEMDPEFRRGAQLMMVRANNPLTLTAGRLYRVNLETLGRIQQLVYSALTMLSSTMTDAPGE